MKSFRTLGFALTLFMPSIASADISEEASACIDELRKRVGDIGGEVLGQSGGQAGVLVRLKDANGTEYECIVWSGPEVAALNVVGGEGASADDGGGAMAGSSANGGPEFWEVRVGSTLNVRSGPSASSPTFFKLPNGSIVRNLGCQENEGRRWCQVPTGPTDGGTIGWVAAEFLVPGSAPPGGANAMIPVSNSGSNAAAAGSGTSERVRFTTGTTGTEFTDRLMPGASKRYVLGASNGQFLYFRLAANGPNMAYSIRNPDGSYLIDRMGAAQDYRGQLWQSGDHVIEVYNTASGAQSFNVIFGIE